MEIAISTGSLNPSTTDALQRATALGFSQVEINLQPDEFGYGYKRKTNARFYRSLARTISELKLKVWSSTTPPLTQLQMFSAQARKDILMSSAIASGLVGSRVFVVSPLDIFQTEDRTSDYFDKAISPPVIEGFDEAWVQAVNRRVTMAMRNEDFWIGIPMFNRPERMDKVTTDLAVGLALDIRQGVRRAELDQWLTMSAERIATAYIYDTTEEGEVCAPMDESWRSSLQALKATRIKTIVVRANPNQNDDEIKQSIAFVNDCLAS